MPNYKEDRTIVMNVANGCLRPKRGVSRAWKMF